MSRRVKPIRIMHTPDVFQDEKMLAIEAIEEILDIVGINISIIDSGVWRDKNYITPDGKLVAHKSVDWYIYPWYDAKRKQVNAQQIINQLFDAYIKGKDKQCYNVILTAEDLYAPGTNFVVGGGLREVGAIISVRRFRNVPKEREVKKQEVYHEIGHVFGAPDPKRGISLEESLGLHCTNLCAMRQGLRVPYDWLRFVEEREASSQIYCNLCIDDMKRYFGKL